MAKSKKNHVIPGVIVGILVLIYLFSPLDMIPDFFTGFGQIDDALILIAGIVYEIVNLIRGIGEKPEKQKADHSTYEEDRKEEYGSFREI